MGFRYVDRIFKIDSKEVEALKLITRQEPYWVWFDRKKYINPSVLVESLFQLLIWDRGYESNFSKINLVKYIEEINFYQRLSFSDKIFLNIKKEDFSSTFIKENICKDKSSSYQKVMDSKGVVVEEKDLETYCYKPLMISLFKNLYRPDLREDEFVSECIFRYKELPYNINHISYDFIDGIYEMSSSYIKGFKNFSGAETFIEESKNKVVPISIILMTALEFCCFLKQGDLNSVKRQDLELVSIKKLDIKKHIKQGCSGVFIVESIDDKTMKIEVKCFDEVFVSALYYFK